MTIKNRIIININQVKIKIMQYTKEKSMKKIDLTDLYIFFN